ncbi:MAG: hypothetical protein GF331_03455, partial [Chitinivibrionales bacterium]|nr:hypothetical protein [Chitinivibrionales bacterium]
MPMSTKLLHRADAPFEQRTWQAIDQTVVAAARNAMSVRRMLHTESPHGLALRALAGPDQPVSEETDETVSVHAAAMHT